MQRECEEEISEILIRTRKPRGQVFRNSDGNVSEEDMRNGKGGDYE